jgi:hypothetical protein
VDYVLVYFFKERRLGRTIKLYSRLGFLAITSWMLWVFAWSLILHKSPLLCALEILPFFFNVTHHSLYSGNWKFSAYLEISLSGFK